MNTHNKSQKDQSYTIGITSLIIGTALIGLAFYGGMKIQEKYFNPAYGISQKTCDLRTLMRKLWFEHAVWDREFIVARVDNEDAIPPVQERLMQNLNDLGNAMASFYDREVGKMVTDMLTEHILLGDEVVKAAKAGDKETQKKMDALWHENAKAMAIFLSKINPNWSESALQKMFYEHLSWANKIADSRIKKEWKKHVKSSDGACAQALEMADAITAGLVKQFPDKL